jgi:predicted TIM-barrel fold metal-dependent hydrolase
MAFQHKAISVDSHVQEKPNTWTSRMSKAKWGERIPHIVEVDSTTMFGNQKESWLINNEITPSLAACQAVMPNRMTTPTRWSEVPACVYEAPERAKAMDLDGVSGCVFYPNVSTAFGIKFLGMQPEFEDECVRAYNDYVAEEWMGYDKNRFYGLAILPYSSMERTLTEVKRIAKLGHVGVTMLGTPQHYSLPYFGDNYWEPLWATLEELKLSANFHSLAGKPAWMGLDFPKGHETRHNAASIAASGESFQAQHFAQLLFTGVIENHPGINFAIAESGVGWIPYMLEASDNAWEAGQLWKHGIKLRPSETFRRQCYADFWFEYTSIQGYRDIVGEDRIMWEDDFPHPTALYPNTQELLGKLLKGLPEGVSHKFLVDNPKRCYRID